MWAVPAQLRAAGDSPAAHSIRDRREGLEHESSWEERRERTALRSRLLCRRGS